MMEWSLGHAAFLLSKLAVGADGKTPYERSTGRRWHGKLVEFGEQVMAKLTKPKSRSRMAKKTQARWVRATWVGLTERTGEQRVVSKTGKAFKVRSVKRLPEQLRWNRAAIEEIRPTPRHPDPLNVKVTEIGPATNGGERDRRKKRRKKRQKQRSKREEHNQVGWEGGGRR